MFSFFGFFAHDVSNTKFFIHLFKLFGLRILNNQQRLIIQLLKDTYACSCFTFFLFHLSHLFHPWDGGFACLWSYSWCGPVRKETFRMNLLTISDSNTYKNFSCNNRFSFWTLSFSKTCSVLFFSVRFAAGRWTKFSSLFPLFFGSLGSPDAPASTVKGLRPSEARNLFVSSMESDARSVPSRSLSDVSFACYFVGVADRDRSSSDVERRSRFRIFSTRLWSLRCLSK